MSDEELRQWVSLVAALLYLGLAGGAALVRQRGPLTPPFGRMCAALFAYEAFEFLKSVTAHPDHQEVFEHLECAAASLVAPTTAAVVISFLGAWRSHRWLVIAGASYFSFIAALCLGATVHPSLATFSGDSPWAIALLAGLVPEFGYLAVLLVRHARRSGARERARTQLLSLALVLGAGSAGSDLLSIAGMPSPRIAMFGLIAAAPVLAALAFQMDLIATARRLLVANAIAVLMVAALLQAVALTYTDRPVLLVTISIAVTLAALVTLRPMLALQAEERARLRQLASLGRLSAQMAHDLKNPLAAIRGAAQFLLEERARGESIDEHEAFLSLILEQTDRATHIVDDYQRIGRAEASRRRVKLVPLLEELQRAQQAASSAHPITLACSVDASIEVAIDSDLVSGALENLLRNAREATPEGGPITLGADRDGARLVLFVEDRGPGMDPRAAEQAFDDFFTTKATGSGLGLAFVARVAEAHGGKAFLRTSGQGTRVTLELALAEGAGHSGASKTS